MSNNIWDHPEITSERIEKSMRQARIERSKAVWAILQSLFLRPEGHEKDNTDFSPCLQFSSIRGYHSRPLPYSRPSMPRRLLCGLLPRVCRVASRISRR